MLVSCEELENKYSNLIIDTVRGIGIGIVLSIIIYLNNLSTNQSLSLVLVYINTVNTIILNEKNGNMNNTYYNL